MSECFPKSRRFWVYMKVKLDLSNYAKKTDLKNATDVDTSKLAKRLI